MNDSGLSEAEMPNPDRLLQIAQELRDGRTAPPVTVREFLSWFGAQRRGYAIVSHIRETLSDAGLRTEPDFESAYIDSPISFLLGLETVSDEGSPPNATEPTAPIGLSIIPSTELLRSKLTYADPTYRISKLDTSKNL